MVLRLVRVIKLIVAIFCTVGPLSEAWAQTAPPPVRQNIDSNGVDLLTGTYNTSSTDVSLGNTSTAQGLALKRYWQGTLLRYNTMASMTLSGTTMTVSIANVSDRFSVSGTTYMPLLGNGSSLTLSGSIFTYAAHDGTVVTFNKNYVNVVTLTGEQARATDIVRPNGEHLVLSYTQTQICARNKQGGSGLICTGTANLPRLATVSNTSGYELYFSYATQGSDLPQSPNVPTTDQIASYMQVVSITDINLAIENCVPGSCTHSWPQAGYTQSGATYTVADPLGRTTTYTLGSSGLTAIKLPASSTNDVTIGYNASGQVSSITTASGATTYTYAVSGNTQTTTVTDALSHATSYTFDVPSQTLRNVTNPLGYTTSYQVDSYGRVTQVTAPEGNYTQTSYDARGNVTQTTAVSKTPGTPANNVTTANYDVSCTNAVKCNQPNWTKDALGNETDYVYDPTSGQVTSVTAPAKPNGVRPQTRYSYTPVSGTSLNLLTGVSTCQTTSSCTGTSDEIRTTITYGSNELATSTVVAAGDGSLSETSSTGYDIYGNATSQTDPLGNISTILFDSAREVIQTISPDPDGSGPLLNRSVTIAYNLNGQPTKITQGTSNADGSGFSALTREVITYDSSWRKATDASLVAGVTISLVQYSYDAAGRVICTAQRMNTATYTSLPATACTLGTAGSFGNDRITQTNYDVAGHVLNTVTGLGDTTQRTYATQTYNANGTVFNLTDGNGNLTSYTYDGFDRLVETHYAVPGNGTQRSPTDYDAYNYDANGNVTSRKLRDGQSISYSYDALNRLTTKTLPSPEPSVTYSYTNQGKVLVTQGGTTLTNAYDGLGRLIGEGQPFGSMAYQYDADNRATRVTWGDGLYVQYDHLATGEVSAIRENGATSGIGVLASYTYDNWGRLTNIARGNGVASTIGYNAADATLNTLNHAIPSAAVTYTLSNYSPAGQIGARARDNDAYAFPGYTNVNRNYTTNGLNQYTNAGGTTSFTYDARGNLTNSGINTYGYTSENLMKSGPGGPTLYYDPAGRLSEYDTSVSTRFVYTGSQIASELNNNGSNTLLRRYVWGPGSDVPLVWYEGTGTADRRWLATDERGSVVAITNASGALMASNSYDDYGIPASTNLGRFQYTGQAWLPEIGLYEYKARMYSPTLGRFMQTDPIGYGDGPNWYNYVGSDPINNSDPLGLRAITCDANGNCTDENGGNVDTSSVLQSGDTVTTKDGTYYAGSGSVDSVTTNSGDITLIDNFSGNVIGSSGSGGQANATISGTARTGFTGTLSDGTIQVSASQPAAVDVSAFYASNNYTPIPARFGDGGGGGSSGNGPAICRAAQRACAYNAQGNLAKIGKCIDAGLTCTANFLDPLPMNAIVYFPDGAWVVLWGYRGNFSGKIMINGKPF